MDHHWDWCWRNRDKFDELMKEYKEKQLPAYFDAMQKRLEENVSKKWIAGDKMTIADIFNLAFAMSHIYNPKDEYGKMH